MPKLRKTPQRTCVGCGKVADKRDLVRIVRTPEGDVAVDLTGKRSGRGAYVCAERGCLQRAVGSGKLARALEVEVPEDVVTALSNRLGGVDES
ncbi:MAG TPA: DUF448 domain-containing protein [Firmicutes bacterium]|jgi:hypothetical protein|nr:DUF448 domain-containing protein [Bacillota bacterium]HBK59390.1 DUF448 domain-containing protein [Bacillota bacterium]